MATTEFATTTTYSTFGDGVPDSWYLIVSTSSDSSRVVQLDDGCDLLFGRAKDCNVLLDHDGVSRRHAAFRRRGENITIGDLESRNGTLVNGVRIPGVQRLAPGDVVSIGPVNIVVAIASAARPSRPIATIGEFEDRLGAEVDRAARYRRPLGIAMLRLEGPPEAVVAHIQRLNQRLRRMDQLAEYGPDELVLLLPETDRDAAEQVAQRACEAAGIAVRVGVAAFPIDGSQAGELVSVARERLRSGRPPARVARGTGPQPRPIDGNVVVADQQMIRVFELAQRVAASPITVLVTGETGTGKEVVADAIHRISPRAAEPYVRLNCASLHESLVEAELFGYEKGAFTGAVSVKPGYFEAASGGTLFLDEIGELSPGAQAKLLRVLEHRRVSRVGGTDEIPVDVRLVCATHRDLEAEVRRGRFRADLYFRISAFVIPVPPLRDRRSEIPLLAAHFARELAGDNEPAQLAQDAAELMSGYDWPGNVRELRNVIERALVICGGRRIEAIHLPERVREASRPASPQPMDVRRRVATFERDAVVAALETSNGNQTHAAKKLGISRFALIRLMEKHGLKPRRD